MITIQEHDLDALDRRLQVAQSVVWSASESLAEYGDPDNAAALVYAFQELRDEINRHRAPAPYRPD